MDVKNEKVILFKNLKPIWFSLNFPFNLMSEQRQVCSSPTVINNPVDGQHGEPLQPLRELRLAGLDRVLLAQSPLHHHVKLVTCHRAHLHQKRIGLSEGEFSRTFEYMN